MRTIMAKEIRLMNYIIKKVKAMKVVVIVKKEMLQKDLKKLKIKLI